MPINNDERAKLELAIASFDDADNVAVARLFWDTLHSARASSENPNGLAADQIFALGKLIHDRAEWTILATVEEQLQKRPIRFPLMMAVEKVFRASLANSLPKLAEEHRQAISTPLSKMDPDELKILTVLFFDTLTSTDFIATDQGKTGEIHPVAKWLVPGWTWDEIKTMPPVVRGICLPLIASCQTYFREHFPTIFRNEEAEVVAEAQPSSESPSTDNPPADPSSSPPTASAPASAETTAPPSTTPEEAPIELKPDEDEAAATDQEGQVSDSDPFMEPTAAESAAIAAQAEDDDTHSPEPSVSATSPPPQPEPPRAQLSQDASGETVLIIPTEEPPEAQEAQEAHPNNGHRLSKKERREIKRRQREGGAAS